MRHELVVASTNKGKLAELRAMLGPMGVDVRGVHEVLTRPVTIVEDGDTFEANAKKKALVIAELTGLLTLADDSGLEVDALGGQPGVRSARYAGEKATDAENNAALLAALGALVEASPGSFAGTFTARFRCVLALVDPFGGTSEPTCVSGVCEGVITMAPRGSAGFGYDPLFVVEGHRH